MGHRANSVLVLSLAILAALTVPAIARAEVLPPQGVGVVTGLAGSVTVTRLAGSVQALKVGDALYLRDVVEARADGIARIRLTKGTTLTVRPLTRLQVREERRTTGVSYTLDLLRAKLRTSLARAFLRQGEQTGGGLRNAVASVRG